MKRINLEQGSVEWLEFRKNKIGASEVAAIMGLSKWKTAVNLWKEKLNIVEPDSSNFYMQRGLESEHVARKIFEERTGINVEPAVYQDDIFDYLIASLDGISSDGKIIIEIKCPGTVDHLIAYDGEIPDHYMPQLQMQMYICKVKSMYYISHTDLNTIILEVHRDDAFIENMLKWVADFDECLNTFTLPSRLTNHEYFGDDDQWILLAKKYKYFNAQKKIINKNLEEAKENLIRYANGKSVHADNIQLTKCITKGRIVYSDIPELEGVDLEAYRSKAIESWRIKDIDD